MSFSHKGRAPFGANSLSKLQKSVRSLPLLRTGCGQCGSPKWLPQIRIRATSRTQEEREHLASHEFLVLDVSRAHSKSEFLLSDGRFAVKASQCSTCGRAVRHTRARTHTGQRAGDEEEQRTGRERTHVRAHTPFRWRRQVSARRIQTGNFRQVWRETRRKGKGTNECYSFETASSLAVRHGRIIQA